jgi:hypothetical protein
MQRENWAKIKKILEQGPFQTIFNARNTEIYGRQKSRAIFSLNGQEDYLTDVVQKKGLQFLDSWDQVTREKPVQPYGSCSVYQQNETVNHIFRGNHF